MKIVFDRYTLMARLMPTLVVIAPIGTMITILAPIGSDALKTIVGIISTFGITILLAEIGRDQGKNKEPRLFKLWSGKPSSLLLSHHETTFSKQTVKRFHSKLSCLIPNLRLPLPQEELDDRTGAMDIYNSCSDYLREKTRDHEKYALVFDENINYGFRRNLWAMKPAGLVLSALGMLFCITFYFIGVNSSTAAPIMALVGFIFNTFLFVIWALRITPQWVQLTAFGYAERLLASLDLMD